MRFSRLELMRFGRFTDASLELPTAGQDFHIIYGPNEAGKSTTLDAIENLLFGVPKNSPYSYLHEPRTLRIGAMLQHKDQELYVRRRKGNKDTLLDEADSPIDEHLLLRLLGGADQRFYQRMFSLDHERLRRGGEAILNSDDDVGKILFAAGSGLGGLSRELDALEQEADRLWSKNRSKHKLYYIAENQLADADRLMKEEMVLPARWKQARKDFDEASKRCEELNAEHSRAQATLARLDRIRRVLPELRKFDTLTDQLGQYGSGPASRGLNQDLLGRAQQIKELSDDAVLIRKHLKEKPHNLALMETQIESLHGIAAELGWKLKNWESASEQMPGRVDLLAIQSLIDRKELLDSQLESTAKRSNEAAEQYRNVQKKLDRLGAARDVSALSLALRLAEQSRACLERGKLADRRISAARRKLEACRPALQPWDGDDDALRVLPIPALAVIEQHEDEHDRLHERSEEQARTYRRITGEIARTELERSQLMRGAAVSEEDLRNARQARMQQWARIRSTTAPSSELMDDFEALQARADEKADLRFEHAHDSAKLSGLEQSLERLKLDLKTSKSEEDSIAARREEFQSRWETLWKPCRLEPLSPGEMKAWLHTVETARGYIEEERQAIVEAAEAEQEIEKGRAKLIRALEPEASAAGSSAQLEAMDLNELILYAGSRRDAIREDAARRETLSDQLQDAESALALAKQKLNEAELAEQGWRKEWLACKAKLKLDKDEDYGATMSRVANIHRAIDCLDKIRQIKREKIDECEHDIALFEEHVDALFAHVASGEQAGDTALERFEQIRALYEQEARRQEALSDTEKRLSESLAAIENHGDGKTLDELRAETATADPDQVLAEINGLRSRCDELQATLQQLTERKTEARLALDAIAGSADAAAAGNTRQQALADMQSHAERVTRLKTASILMRWAIDRYRRNKQAPMLKRASVFFNALTLGEFERLGIEYDDSDKAQLAGIRRNGGQSEVKGLSDGTVDQLYLSLRLAAIEEYLAKAEALPFIADDLFINFDDERARAGIKLLAKLSQRTQILFFTHHIHLAEMAESELQTPVHHLAAV